MDELPFFAKQINSIVKNIVVDAETILTTDIFNGSEYSVVAELIETLHSTVVQPLALMIMLIFFFGALIDKMSSENFTWEQMARQMGMFFVSYYLILHGMDLLRYMFQIGQIFLTDFTSAMQTEGIGTVISQDLVNDFKDSLNFKGILKVLGDAFVNIYLLVPWLLTWIIGMAVNVICYSRIIEIYLRITFAPIALSDFFMNGFNGAGWRFLKSFLAVCIQGAMIFVIIVLFSKLMPVVLTNGDGDARGLFGAVGVYLAFLASAVMLMFKSQSLCKELLGVN